MFERARRDGATGVSSCGCETTIASSVLRVDGSACAANGDLVTAPACRRTVVSACRDRSVDGIWVRDAGFERRYGDGAVALFVAAGRFQARLAARADPLADLVLADPLAAASEATARAPPIGDWVGMTGLAIAAREVQTYDAFQIRTGPTVAPVRLGVVGPADDAIASRRSLSTGATATEYHDDRGRRRYHLRPPWTALDRDARETFGRAYERLAAGDGAGTAPIGAGGRPADARAYRRAVDAVTNGPADGTVVDVLRRQTTGHGILEDAFADPAVTDVYAPSDPDGASLRVDLAEHGSVPTNGHLTADGAMALASSIRAASGRAFSRATPTVDAATTVDDVPIRVAGVRSPVADGVGFAFRRGTEDAFTLPELIENGTVTPSAAALLSLATRRAAATLVAGARGAGKTTLLGALCFELEPTTRTVLVEDTPELPIDALRADDRDVQGLRTSETGDGLDAAGALRTALRLGEGALVVGEVRGSEARVLYEAMRVGASSDAVLGTIHGDGATAVRERVVEDLGVSPSSFAATDCVVTCRRVPVDGVSGCDDTGKIDRDDVGELDRGDAGAFEPGGAGKTERRVARIEEVVGEGDRASFEPLYELSATGRLEPTGRIRRGNSALVAALAGPTGDYADARDALAARRDRLAERATTGRHDPVEWTA